MNAQRSMFQCSTRQGITSLLILKAIKIPPVTMAMARHTTQTMLTLYWSKFPAVVPGNAAVPSWQFPGFYLVMKETKNRTVT